MLRDRDFEREFPVGVRVSENMYNLIMGAIKIDSQFLDRDVQTTDYSLLVGFRKLTPKDSQKLDLFLEGEDRETKM